ncbi:mitochondrial inner membrane protein OXA1L [Lepeophtheirus salmonis]|uniref:mitochondrial inner membrane protein OXA1L n=1 Tax=Lepeophtheirus salmonis TaxID=72036 RepID=UPI001AE155AD|nr:mitochondrial inner membrane protein OXA1L-like [Lepeophtheirus salmonis]
MLWTVSIRRVPLAIRHLHPVIRDQWKPFSTYNPLREKDVSSTTPKLEFIPEKPSLVSPIVEPQTSLVEIIASEPSLRSQGLAGWSPPGILQWGMENLHVGVDIPWWGTILATTCILRVAVFPLVIFSQKNAARLNQCLPEMKHIQSRLSDARKRGDIIEVQKWSIELQKFMEERDVKPVKNFIPIIIQAPIFMSMFFALRGMANLPLDSMMIGGLGWFEDLTISDPYYVLPALVASTFYLQIYFAVDGANMQSMGTIGKTVCKAVPFIMFPLIMNFPTALTFYWTATNVIAVFQVKFIRNKAVRKYLGIPEFIDWSKKKDTIQQKDKGFKDSVKDVMDNWKVQKDVIDRRAFDEQMFREAGLQKKRRTYKFNPTAPMLSSKGKQ